MSAWALAALGLGGCIAALNFWLSFLAARVHRLRRGTEPARVPSGVPLVGSVLLAAAAFALPNGSVMQLAALVLLALDTGGPHWFVLSQVSRRRPASRP